VAVFDGRIEGRTLRAGGTQPALLQWSEQGLRLERIGTPGADHAGRLFTPAGAAGCPSATANRG
jgi:hypothetical protein